MKQSNTQKLTMPNKRSNSRDKAGADSKDTKEASRAEEMRSNSVHVFGRLKSEPIDSKKESSSAVKSKSKLDTVSFKNKPVELPAGSMQLGGRPASLPATTKKWRDKDHNRTSNSAREAPSSLMSKSELDTASFKDKPVDSRLVCQHQEITLVYICRIRMRLYVIKSLNDIYMSNNF